VSRYGWRTGAVTALLFAAGAAQAQPGGQAAEAPGNRAGDTLRYPYVAAFSRSSGGDRVYFCAGALVAPRWILTAAHCFHNPRGARVTNQGLAAEVGASWLGEVPIEAQVAVARIIVHPDYDRESQDNDIALVELAEEAGPLIAEVATARAAPDAGQATVLGFGSFYEGRLAANALSRTGAPVSQSSDRLRQASVRLVDSETCAARLGAGRAAPGANQICAGAGPDATCIGDSGAPLIVAGTDRTDRVAGIVSLGSGCAADRPVTVYTRVSAYAGWIAATIRGR
jgi:secreted trypsin-like serine protease